MLPWMNTTHDFCIVAFSFPLDCCLSLPKSRLKALQSSYQILSCLGDKLIFVPLSIFTNLSSSLHNLHVHVTANSSIISTSGHFFFVKDNI